MKLLKIGSAQSNDIVLHSVHVSAHHAELTLLDSGEILIEDKSSSNGTYVGNKRIEPNTEVAVHRGDYIRFADADLVWGRVPVLPNLSGYNAVINIGSNFRNDIVVNGGAVSRYHATVLVKGRKAFIRDNNSKNGIQLNGIKITPGKEVPLKKGDNVLCAGEDITDQLSSYIPSAVPSWLKWGSLSSLVSILVVAAFLLFPSKPLLKGCIPPPPIPEVDPNEYVNSVAYFEARYYFYVEFEDNPLPSHYWNGVMSLTDRVYTYSGTAFFLDREGRMATNRHIAEPWNYRSKEEEDFIRDRITQTINNVTGDVLHNEIHPETSLEFELLSAIVSYVKNEKLQENPSMSPSTAIETILSRLRKSQYTIKGKLMDIKVGYPGLYYTEDEEYDHCNVLRVATDQHVDIALLQLNNHQTPQRVTKYFDINSIYLAKLVPMEDELFTIGYPAGKNRGVDETTKSLKPTILKTQCVKDPTRYKFEIQSPTIGGSSGSPIFNKYGKLVGILFGGYQNSTTFGVHARYLKSLYDEEVNF